MYNVCILFFRNNEIFGDVQLSARQVSFGMTVCAQCRQQVPFHWQDQMQVYSKWCSRCMGEGSSFPMLWELLQDNAGPLLHGGHCECCQVFLMAHWDRYLFLSTWMLPVRNNSKHLFNELLWVLSKWKTFINCEHALQKRLYTSYTLIFSNFWINFRSFK